MGTTPTGYSTSAALLFTEQELGGPCVENESFPSVLAGVPNVVCPGNGDRVGLIIMNVGNTDAWLSVSSGVASNAGIFCPANGGFISLTVRDDFTLPSRQWWSTSLVTPTTLYVLEIVRFKSILGGQ